VSVGRAAKRAVSSALAARGYEVRRIAPTDVPLEAPAEPGPDPRTVDYFARAGEIDARHAAQTLDDVDALRRRYGAPVFGTVRVWDLVERLSGDGGS
jgi:nucleotide-binding universal stress UspA family protein